jgi:hypothetical protein
LGGFVAATLRLRNLHRLIKCGETQAKASGCNGNNMKSLNLGSNYSGSIRHICLSFIKDILARQTVKSKIEA